MDTRRGKAEGQSRQHLGLRKVVVPQVRPLWLGSSTVQLGIIAGVPLLSPFSTFLV